MKFFLLVFLISFGSSLSQKLPLVINTWNFTNANIKAWEVLYEQNGSPLDALEAGCTQCEVEQCDKTVGYGGSPDEKGETTLDAMMFDGSTMNMGAVGSLRRVKSAISVARKVLENTMHSLLVGDQATRFAIQMGFKQEPLETDESIDMWHEWKADNCQPNFWQNVYPNPREKCGPYTQITENDINFHDRKRNNPNNFGESNHDTIGMIVISSDGHIVAGTSTNGARNKIPGRVGDSPIPGAGAYADSAVGAAAATGEGDIMMRFLPSFVAVDEIRRGSSPENAAQTAIDRILQFYPIFFGAVIATNKDGDYGAACTGMEQFHFYVANPSIGPSLQVIDCKK